MGNPCIRTVYNNELNLEGGLWASSTSRLKLHCVIHIISLSPPFIPTPVLGAFKLQTFYLFATVALQWHQLCQTFHHLNIHLYGLPNIYMWHVCGEL